jgi:putative tricarboxylic transport membrane protein
MRKVARSTLAGLLGTLTLAAGSLAVSQDVQAWEPKKPVDFVIMAGKGGGADKMARLMQSIIEKHKLASKPIVPNNKPGGSGAEALVHLKNTKGLNADHTIMVTLNSFYTTPMRQPKLKVDSLSFAPIGRMAEDTFLLWVHKDSGIDSFKDFVTAAKAKGNDWIMAGTGKGQEDQLLTDFLNRTYELNMKYVPYKGGGRVAKELAGKHANSTVNNPSEALGFYEAGTVKALAAFTPNRIALFNQAPTFNEMGKNFSYFMQRSVVGAPGMSADAQAYYSDLFKKVYDSSEWQTYMKKKALQGEFLSGAELQSYWKENNDRHRTMLKQIGEIK